MFYNRKMKEVIMPQEYGNEEEWKNHFNYLLAFFLDSRYIRIDGKPMFLIYRPELIPELDEMLSFWTELAIQSGFNGLYIVSQGTVYGTSENKSKVINDYILYEPGYTQAEFSLVRGNVFKKFMMSPLMFCRPTPLIGACLEDGNLPSCCLTDT